MQRAIQPTLLSVLVAVSVLACQVKNAGVKPVEEGAEGEGEGAEGEGEGEGEPLECPTEEDTCFHVEAPPGADKACPGTRWVGPSPDDGPCPGAGGLPGDGGRWRVDRLFQVPEGAPDLIESLPPAMRRYCVYEWEPRGAGGRPDLDALPGGQGEPAEWLDRDCAVLGGQADALSEHVWTRLHAAMAQRIGRMGSLPIRPEGEARPAQVRVAIVDSATHGFFMGEAGRGQLAHGRMMGLTVRELGCPNNDTRTPDCLAAISNHLALPREDGLAINLRQGGFFGFQSELARAIHQAVLEWKMHGIDHPPGDRPQPRLVINLSVGWEPLPEYGGEFERPADLPAPARAVHAAITDAVCRGALVIAAAGNDTGGAAPSTGPMYPAAWEQRPAPDKAACEAFEPPGALEGLPLPVFPPRGQDPYRPLVYAVAGVDGLDEPLGNTRVDGRPRLAAYADHGVAEDLDAGGLIPSAILSGSSVAAAVVSGIAAVAWAYGPPLRSDIIMELVYGSGVDLATPAEFHMAGVVAPPIRRVSACDTVRAVCSLLPAPAACPAALPPCTTPAAGEDTRKEHTEVDAATLEGALFSADADGDGQVDNAYAITPHSLALPAGSPCDVSEITADDPALPDYPCPDAQYVGGKAVPWVGPQPSDPGCSVCALCGDALYLGINEDFTGTLTDPVLSVWIGGVEFGFSLAKTVPVLNPGDVAVVEGLGLAATPEGSEISFLADDGGKKSYSVSDQVLVWTGKGCE